MFRVSWHNANDPYVRRWVLVPNVYALFNLHFILTGYGRGDGLAPCGIEVTDLEGNLVDMNRGIAGAAGQGTI